ncbi:MAG TPA: peptidoglycan-binding protein [Trebonia sp.]|jgi:peptidoglycan hydrolase-like protein with peptidoglycan-binding domain|nr:peptidoglycan-binding protein [Trebonia sp.]
MKRIRSFSSAAAALAIASVSVLLPTFIVATPASAATLTCGGTSLVDAASSGLMRVPTVGNATPSKWVCQLAPGDSGSAVARLQIDLNDCYNTKLTVDGMYGPKTQAAVKVAQAAEFFPPSQQDGIYGPQTIEDGFQYQIQGDPVGPPTSCSNILGTS